MENDERAGHDLAAPGVPLDEEWSWIPPTLLVLCPVPARSAPRVAPA
jgi:hypothetical protein